jgi:hypothetical protein
MPDTPETTAAYRELMAFMTSIDERFFEGPNAPPDEQSVLEGYKWIFSILQVACDVYLWGDKDNPRFVDIVGPYKKWGGDNADAYYQFFPVDPRRSYRVTGTRGDSVYLSLTVYGGPDDGRYTDRIVGIVNDRDLSFGPDGEFELLVAPERPEGYEGAFLRLEDDAVHAITRDYLEDPVNGTRVTWHVEAVDPPETYRLTDAELARRIRAVITWITQQSSMVPLGMGTPNHVDDPYPVPQKTFGWAAGDAAYAMGSFDLSEDQALVLEGNSPECAFWNLCLWNPFMHTYNYDYERVTINGAQVEPEPDGSWRIVVAQRDPGCPNWVSTQGHPRGRLWFRWFYPSQTPGPVQARLVSVSSLTP